jgi:predicted lipoprotein with Yx(FWY)xxD motif
VTVKLMTTHLGRVLATAHGYTLYRYTPDRRDHPTCTGACATVWPPLLLAAGQHTPTAGSGVSGLGTVRVADNRLQVTVHGVPLYRYVGDRSPGSASGQGVGGTWFVVRPGWTPTAAGSSHPTTTTTKASGGGYGY